MRNPNSECQSLHEGVFCVGVVVDGDFGGEVVGEVIELSAAANGNVSWVTHIDIF